MWSRPLHSLHPTFLRLNVSESDRAAKMSKATIPVKVLHEAVPHTVSVEMKNGEAYRGKLAAIEENMNCLVESRGF